VAEKDEVNFDELEPDPIAEAEPADPDDVAVEPTLDPVEPIFGYGGLLKIKNDTYDVYKDEIRNEQMFLDFNVPDSVKIKGDEAVEQWYEDNPLDQEKLDKKIDEIIGDRGVIVGDQPDEGLMSLLVGNTYVSAFSRVHSQFGTIPTYQAAAAEARKDQGKSLYNRAYHVITEAPPETLNISPEMTFKMGLTDREGNIIEDTRDKELLGVKITNDRLKMLTAATTTVGVGLGAYGGSAGGPVGVVGGALLMGMTGLGLGAGGSAIISGLADVPDEYSRLDYLTDLAKRGYTNLGLYDDFVDAYVLGSEEIRNALVTNVVETANALNIKDAVKMMDKYGITNFEELQKQTKKSVEAHEEQLKNRTYELTDMAVDFMQVAPAGPYSPFLFMGTNEWIQDAFLLDLADIKAQILANPEYQEARSRVRKESLVQKKYDLDVESRKQKPSQPDRFLITPYEMYRDGQLNEEEKNKIVQEELLNISFNELAPDLRKEQPDLDLFKQIASMVPKDHRLLTADIEPALPMAIQAVHMGMSDDQIQSYLNTIPFGIFATQYLFEEVTEKSLPTQKELDEWASSVVVELEKRGSKGSKKLERQAFSLFTEMENDPKLGVYFKRSFIGEILNWAGVATTAAAEAELSISDGWVAKIASVPGTDQGRAILLKKLGLPNGIYLPTPAGLDRMLNLGIRHADDNFITRFDARMDAALGGFQVGYAEVAAALGYRPDSIQYNLLQNLGMFMDMFLNLERRVIKVSGMAGRTVYNSKGAVQQFFDSQGSNSTRFKLAKQALFEGVVENSSVDPLVRVNSLIEAGLRHQKNKGIRIFQPFDETTGLGLTQAERELVRRVLLLADREPEKYIASDVLSSNDISAVRKVTQSLIEELGRSEVAVFRSSGAYKRIDRQVQNLVNSGAIDVDDKMRFMAMVEYQAFKIADAVDTPFANAVEVIQNLAVTRNRPIKRTAPRTGEQPVNPDRVTDADGGTIALRLEDPNPDPDIRLARKNNKTVGYFEYTPATRRSIINFFQDGDVDVLWQANGHMMSTLMGYEWNAKINRFFDHNVDSNGVRRLTDLGHEQFAEAWRMYRRIKDAKNGALRRLFDELWIALQNFYSSLRRKNGLLPKEVREYWDLEFGTLPSDRRYVDALTNAAVRKRPYAIFVDEDVREQVRQSRPAKLAREETAKEPSMDSKVIHQYLGDKFEVRVDVSTDPVTGKTVRTPRRVYADTTDDAIDVLIKAIAYVKTAKYRKEISSRKTSIIGTGKYIVPVNRLKPILESVKERLTEALGGLPGELARRLRQRGQDGFVDRSNLPPSVRRSDLVDFDDRQRMQSPGPRALVDREIKKTEFYVLSDSEVAGLKTLLQEISKNPAADQIPFGLIDPDANLRILSYREFDLIHKVMQDIEAGPLNRASRNTMNPGLARRLGIYLSSIEATKYIGKRIEDLSNFFSREKLRFNTQNANPELVESIEKHIRLVKKVQEDLVDAIDSARKNGSEYFIDFYQNQISLFIPLVALTKVEKLFQLVDTFNSYRSILDSKTLAAELAQKRAAQQIDPARARVIPEILTSDIIGPDVNYILKNLNDIQDVLDGYYGMTKLERSAITVLRTLKQKGVKTGAITDADRLIFADAVQVLHLGLLEKHNFVQNTALDVFKIAMGVDGQTINWNFSNKQLLTIYKSYYEGDLLTLYQMGATKSLIPLSPDAGKKLFGNVSKQENDAIALLTNVLVYGKVSELRKGLARELANKGYRLNRRQLYQELAQSADLGEVPNLDRQRYIERVVFYIDEELSFQDKVIIARGTQSKPREVLDTPAKPPKDMYGVAEAQPSLKNHPDTQIITEMDKAAKLEASRILDDLGIRRELGTFSILDLGDETLLLPESLIFALEETMVDMYKQPFQFKRNFGKTGTIEYALLGDDVSVPIEIQRSVIDGATRLAEVSPLNPRVFYGGLLIGSGGVPMVPYLFSVYVGAVSQVQLGQGLLAAADDFVSFPKIATEAVNSYNSTKEINFVAGVMARTFGDGQHRPLTKPYVFKDGRILTADAMHKMIIDEGVKGSFVGTLKNVNIHDRILEAFSKSNPWVGGSVIGGTIGGMLGLITAGPVGAAIGATAGAASAGITLGTILKRGNKITRLHRSYAETATAIDTYFRIRIMLRELEKGSSPQEAAKRTRTIALDYSDLGELEQKTIGGFFAFYTYFRQASKLFVKSLIRNPDRVLTQLKIIRASQLSVTDLEDPDRVLPSYERTRLYVPWKIKDHAIRFPFLIGPDVINLLSDILNSIPYVAGEEQTEKSRAALLARANPLFLEAYKQKTGLDPGRGFPIERATNQVPALIVQLDHDIFGGVLHDYLDIHYVPESDLKFTYDQKTGRKLNIRNIEMPGRGIYISTKPLAASFLFDYVQYPVTGRMLGLIEALDRSNIGLTEAIVKAADAYYQADKERPLLARVPGLVELGVVKPTRDFTYAISKRPGEAPSPVPMYRPTDQPGVSQQMVSEAPGVKGHLDTATAHRTMREDFSFESFDGVEYKLRFKDFYPLYLLRFLGSSATYIDKKAERETARKLKQQTKQLKRSE